MEIVVVVTFLLILLKSSWFHESFSNDWYLRDKSLEDQLIEFEEAELELMEQKRVQEMSEDALDEEELRILLKPDYKVTIEDRQFLSQRSL